MNEYQKLLQRYGVSSQQLPYAGLAKPTDTAAPEYEDLMSKYTADRSAYDKWLDAYKKRIASRSVYDPAFTGEILGIPVYEYGAGYTLPKAPTKSVASPAAAPAAFVEPQQAGGAGNYSGSSAPPGGGYGIPGATLVGGISGPTTGLASLANSTAAYLGNLSIDPITGQQKSGPLASIARGISDAIAKNVDPNFSHEGAPGKGTGTVDGITKTDLGSFIIGPTGLTPITAPATEESQTRLDAITGKAAAEAQAAMEAQAQREAANMAARAQAEREAQAVAQAQAQREASIPTGVTGVDPNAGEGGVGGVGAGGYSGGYDGGYGGGYDGGDPGGGGPRAKGGVVGRYAHGGIAALRRYADGGITADGNLNLHIPLDISGGRGGGGGGMFGQAQQQQRLMQSLDQNAITANPQGFADWYSQQQQQPAIYDLMRQQPQFQQQPQASQYSPFGGGMFQGSRFADGGMTDYAQGGLGTLGGYSDGGRLLRGPGDGVSDSIPATIGHKRQPARLADGEFVVPARIVSELGNGSTEAGARKLYAMLDRIQAGRKKSVGKGKVAINSRMDKHLPA